MAVLQVPVSVGELLDKISILEIKHARISDVDKRENVVCELDALRQVRERAVPASTAVDALCSQLRQVNEALWSIEDDIRACERAQCFDAEFIRLARSVYRTNDQRAALKRELNELTGSTLVEEKSYEDY
ncbi:MAG: DUF6165 family protein [Pseudomonadota bacterium]